MYEVGWIKYTVIVIDVTDRTQEIIRFGVLVSEEMHTVFAFAADLYILSCLSLWSELLVAWCSILETG